MNLLRVWSPRVWLGLIFLGVALIVLGLGWISPFMEMPGWIAAVGLLCVLLSACLWWVFDRSHLGATPTDLAQVTRLLAAGQPDEAQSLLAPGAPGAWGDLSKVVTNLQQAKTVHEQRAWRDQGLALIHETVRHDHTPQALADRVSQTLSRFLSLNGCAVYVLEFDSLNQRLHAECQLRRKSSVLALPRTLPESMACGYASLQALAASETILRNEEIPAALMRSLGQSFKGDTVLVPLVIEAQVRGVLLMTSAHALSSQLEMLMEPVSAAIAVAMQSANARETLQASLSRANELTRELQDHHEKLQVSEAALKKQMAYVNDILGNMHSGLAVVDRSGRIEDCNPALLKMTGFDRDLLIGQPSSLLFEEDETRLLSIFKGYGHMLTRLGIDNPAAYKQVLADNLLGACLIDAKGRLLDLNHRFAQLLTCGVDQLKDQNFWFLFQDVPVDELAELQTLQASDDSYYRSGTGLPMGLRFHPAQAVQRVEISLINHRLLGDRVCLVLVRGDRDLPWGVANSTTLQKLTPGGDEDAMVAKLRNRSGTHTPVRVSSSFLADASGMPQQTVINLHDVSSLVNKSEEIRAQHQLLEMSMDAMQDGVLRLDRHGRVISANPMALDLLASDKLSTSLQPVHKLLPGQQKGHDLAYWLPLQTAWLLRRLVKDLEQDPSLMQSLPIPLLYANRMGRLKWATPTACALLGLTASPQSTLEPLLLAEQTSRELMALRDQTDFDVDGQDPLVIEVAWRAGNAPVMRLPTLLVPQSTASNDDLMVWMIPDLDALCAFMIRRMHNIDWVVLHDEERLLPVVLTASPLVDLYNRLTGAVVTIKDMREIKEKEAENLRMVQKVEQSQRLDALGQLAAGVAHDFNNLLGVIQNHAELVEMKLGSDTKAAKNLSAILQATTRARDIVLKLNALGRERKRLE